MHVELKPLRLESNFPSYRVGIFGKSINYDDEPGYSLSLIRFRNTDDRVFLNIDGSVVVSQNVLPQILESTTLYDFRGFGGAVAFRTLQEQMKIRGKVNILEVAGHEITCLDERHNPGYTRNFDYAVSFYAYILERRLKISPDKFNKSASEISSLLRERDRQLRGASYPTAIEQKELNDAFLGHLKLLGV